jgi:hypothetical protein
MLESIQIIAWSTVVTMVGDPDHSDRVPERPPDEQVFDHTITDQQLVQDLRKQFDSRPRGRWSSS